MNFEKIKKISYICAVVYVISYVVPFVLFLPISETPAMFLMAFPVTLLYYWVGWISIPIAVVIFVIDQFKKFREDSQIPVPSNSFSVLRVMRAVGVAAALLFMYFLVLLVFD